MSGLEAVLGLAGPMSLIVALLVIALLSQRLGTITKQMRSYRWLFVAIGLATVSVLTRVWLQGPVDAPIYTLLMAVALTIGAGVAWMYWGWLFHERQHNAPAADSRQSNEGTPP